MNIEYAVIFHHDDQHGGRYSREFLEQYGHTLKGKPIQQNHYPHREYLDAYPLWGENKVLEARYIPELHALAGVISVSERTHERILRQDYAGLSVELRGNEFLGAALMTPNHGLADPEAKILKVIEYDPVTKPSRGSMPTTSQIMAMFPKFSALGVERMKRHAAQSEWLLSKGIPFEELLLANTLEAMVEYGIQGPIPDRPDDQASVKHPDIQFPDNTPFEGKYACPHCNFADNKKWLVVDHVNLIHAGADVDKIHVRVGNEESKQKELVTGFCESCGDYHRHKTEWSEPCEVTFTKRRAN